MHIEINEISLMYCFTVLADWTPRAMSTKQFTLHNQNLSFD